jgi:DNA gyrase subunit A
MPMPAQEPQSANGAPQHESLPQTETIPEPITKAYDDASPTSPQQVLVFTNQAQVYLQEVPENVDINTVIIEELLNGTEKEIYRLSTRDFRGFLIFGYRNGKVDKVSLSAYQTRRRVLKNAYHTEQQLLFIRHFTQAADLAGITQEAKVVVFSTDIVSEHSSRGNQGNQVFIKGSVVKTYKVMEESKLQNPEYYRRTTTNTRGYYLKGEDRF